VLIHLYGFLEGDFLGRVIVVDSAQTVLGLAVQLQAWARDLYPCPTAAPTVTNEQGVLLEPASTLTDAGLSAGDIFHVRGVHLCAS
jgi:hypothetical protein